MADNRCPIDIDDEMLAFLKEQGWQIRPMNHDESHYANLDVFLFLRAPDGTLLRATRPVGHAEREL